MKRRAATRGVTMIIALLVVAILLVVALTVLNQATTAAQNATSVASKSASYNTAEGGLATAINYLNQDYSVADNKCASPPPTLNTITAAQACVWLNNYAGVAARSTPDPESGQSIIVPVGYAYVYSYVAQSSNTHRTWVEALVAKQTLGGIPNAGLNGQDTICDNYNGGTAVNSDMHANNAIVQCNGGAANAGGLTYGYNYNNLRGSDNLSHTSSGPPPAATLITFPSATQMNDFKSAALEAAQSGTTYTGAGFATACKNLVTPCTGNIYVNGDINVSSHNDYVTGGGTVYVNGNIILSGNGTTLDNLTSDTIAVSGYVSITGQSQYVNPTDKGSLIVFGTDASTCVQTITPPTVPNKNPAGCAADMGGLAQPGGLVYAPFGSINLHGNGFEQGSFDAGTTPAQSGGVIYLNGGGVSGGFTAVPTTIQFPPTGLWAIKAYWEY